MSENPDNSNTPQFDKSTISEEDLDNMLAGLGARHKDTELDPSLLVDPHGRPAEKAESTGHVSTDQLEKPDDNLIVPPDKHLPDLLNNRADTSPDLKLEEASERSSLFAFLRKLFRRKT